MATGKIPIIHTDGMEKWYLTDGITENDVVAAYQFIYRPSVEDALVNINDATKYTLTKNDIDYGYTSGLIIPQSQNSYLNNTDFNSVLLDIDRFSAIYGMTRDNENFNACGIHLSGSKWFGISNHMKSGTQAGLYVHGGNNWMFCNTTYNVRKCNLGINFGWHTGDCRIYINGTNQPLATPNSYPYANRYCTFGYQAGDLGAVMTMRVPALVFYRRALSPEQHAAIAKNIAILGSSL